MSPDQNVIVTVASTDGRVTGRCSASYVAVNMTLLAFAADYRSDVDTDRKAAAPAADAPYSNRSISSAWGAQQQTRRTPLLQYKMGQTGRQTDAGQFHRPCSAYYASSANNWSG